MTNGRRRGRDRERDQRRRRDGTRGRDSTHGSRRNQPPSAVPQQNGSNLPVPASMGGPAQQTRPASSRRGPCNQPQRTTYPNNTNTSTANHNTAPQEQEGPQPTAEDAMSEIKFLRIIIQAQQDRIEKLEQNEKRTADVLEALTKLALDTAQNTGYVNEASLKEFGAAIGDV